MKTLLQLFCIVTATTLYADEKLFVYDDHGKHDPFWPMVSPSGTLITFDEDLTAADMTLEGIVADAKGNNLAIINGRIVKKGDEIGSYTIEAVGHKLVDLSKGQEHLTLKLKNGGV